MWVLLTQTWQVLAAICFGFIGIFWKWIAEQNRRQQMFYNICFVEVALLALLVATVHNRGTQLSPTFLVTTMITVIILFLVAWRKLSQRPGIESVLCWVLTSMTISFGLCLELMLAASIAANELQNGSEAPLYDELMTTSTIALIGGVVVAITVPVIKVISRHSSYRHFP